MRAHVRIIVGALLVLVALGGTRAAFPGVPAAADAGDSMAPYPTEVPTPALEAGVVLEPGDVMVLASWRCSYLQLERVNALALAIIEAPLSRMVEEGRLRGWGQLNGDLRADFNYHTFYVARSLEDYRRSLGAVMTHMHGERREEMDEFYRLCETTREVPVTVVTARR